jgi:UDP-GlcNAc:undecaprenyl-phosphate/decaprenyl-phosphate GlcNAc-1-phosphate transferase
MIMFSQIAFYFLVNICILVFFKKISKYFNLYDYPDLKRKKQTRPISLFGGFIFLINLFIFIFFDIFFNQKFFLNNLDINKSIEITFFILIFCSIYIIGYIDDKINIKPFDKLILLLIISYIFIYYNPNFIIITLRSGIINQDIDLFFIAPIFTAICIVAFINAMNMFDGINLVAFLQFSAISLSFMLGNFLIYFSLLMLFSLSIFGYLNFKNLTFFGDSGIYILSFLSAILIIKFYNSFILNIEDILLIIFLPMIDFFRLFFVRIYIGSNPFRADRRHFHNYLNNKYGFKNTIIIYISLIYIPVMLNSFFNIAIYLLIIMTIAYLFLLKKTIPLKIN